VNKNIIFDIGNVLVDFRWKEYLEEFGFGEEISRQIGEAIVLNPVWDEMDLGEKSREQLIALFVECLPQYKSQIQSIFGDLRNMLKSREGTIPWIKELKERGFGVYYLSNYSQVAYEDCYHTLDFLPYMDGGILSFQDKLIKPDPRIYQLLLERYQLDPRSCIFLDDKKENCDAAIKCGIESIVFTNRDEIEKQLEDFLNTNY